uniref:Uncharacterized protein n=1 Tax=Plectus sambesii TaxID=2011161 RepID=A0A914VN22_9BILA
MRLASSEAGSGAEKHSSSSPAACRFVASRVGRAGVDGRERAVQIITRRAQRLRRLLEVARAPDPRLKAEVPARHSPAHAFAQKQLRCYSRRV